MTVVEQKEFYLEMSSAFLFTPSSATLGGFGNGGAFLVVTGGLLVFSCQRGASGIWWAGDQEHNIIQTYLSPDTNSAPIDKASSYKESSGCPF